MVKLAMRIIYISPHLDDAVLSAGGLIYEQVLAGHEVQIWNVMCSAPPYEELSPYARLLHSQWGIDSAANVVAARRAEDANASQIVGAKPVYFDFHDCIYRRGANGEWLYSYIFVPPHEAETDLPARIAQAISARLQPSDAVFCQLAVGGHVDHVVTRHAVELLACPVEYIADIPYHINSPEELPVKTAGMEEIPHPLSGPALEAWILGISAFKTQISSLFKDLADMRDKINSYSVNSGGLITWKKPI